jgi:PAS domain S-box-containing protein
LELTDGIGAAIAVSERIPDTELERVIFVNAAAGELLKRPVVEILGMTAPSGKVFETFLSSDYRINRNEPGKFVDRSFEIRDSNEPPISLRWIEIETVVDTQPLHVHVIRKVERMSGNEPSRLDYELRFRQLLDVAPDGIIVVQARRIVYANQAITRIHGYSHPRQLSQLAPERLFSPEDRELIEHRLLQLKQDPSSIQALETRGVRRDQTIFPVDLQLRVTQWNDAPAVLVSIRDLSGRRLIQSRLVHDDRLAAVGTLAAGVAHEINNPLAYVLLNLQYLMRELPKHPTGNPLAAHYRERLAEARHGTERVAAIVKDLRTFSKVQDEQIGPVDLRQVLKNAVRVARTQLSDRGTIIEDYSENLVALGHAARLEQVFLNLLMNAVQALSPSHRDENKIFVRTYNDRFQTPGYVTVEVADTGAGMTEEVLNRVFDPFFTTKPVGLGTGLGLPICHNIVTKMGGQIRAESRVGFGARFFVSLPISETIRRNLTPGPFTMTIAHAFRARVLVIDDELPVASMFSRVLDEDHDVVIATSAEEALELLERQSFDGMFCDLLMPSMSGMEFYREVMRRYPGFEQRIAFMTGGAFTPKAALFLSQVRNPRIEKPFDLRAVRAIVQNWMSHQDEVP